MQLHDEHGIGVELHVTGYQFPDAADPQQRYSWHVVEGSAKSTDGDWAFRYPALTCDETPRVSDWLRQAAAGDEGLGRLSFTEPNLALGALERQGAEVLLAVELDIEFLPPWRKPEQGPIYAGDPYVLRLQVPVEALLAAATQWDEETAPYPDGLAKDSE